MPFGVQRDNNSLAELVFRFALLFAGPGTRLGDGLGDVVRGGPGPGRDGLECAPEGGLVEPAGFGGLGGRAGSSPGRPGSGDRGTGRAVSEESPRIGCRSGRCLSVFYSLFAGPLAPSWSFVLVLILAFPAAVPTS